MQSGKPRIKRPVEGWEAGPAGRKIKAWREARGLSQQAAAARLGLSISKLQKIEQGAQGFGPELWERIEAYINGPA